MAGAGRDSGIGSACMRWRITRFWTSRDILEAGELARRVHERWLARALERGTPYPRIPVRPMITGGFAPMMSRENGVKRAEQWWAAAFKRMEELDREDRDH